MLKELFLISFFLPFPHDYMFLSLIRSLNRDKNRPKFRKSCKKPNVFFNSLRGLRNLRTSDKKMFYVGDS